MINVIASIHVNPGQRETFIKLFNENIPHVLAEDGCIEYAPTVDITPALPRQMVDENIVTVIEKWATIEALQAHMIAPHMLSFREQVGAIIAATEIKILTGV